MSKKVSSSGISLAVIFVLLMCPLCVAGSNCKSCTNASPNLDLNDSNDNASLDSEILWPTVARAPFMPVQCCVENTFSFATSATDSNGAKIKYIFDWGDGTTTETAFMDSGVPAVVSHKWDKPGTYYIKAKATTSKGVSSGWSDVSIVIVDPDPDPDGNLPPSLISFTSDKPSPQVAGTQVRWTTEAKDPDGDNLYYKYLVKGPQTNGAWQDRTSWIPDKYWSFLTGMFKPGQYQVQVQVRDKNHAGENGYDANKIADFTINPKPVSDEPEDADAQTEDSPERTRVVQRPARG
jgi:hypothetical protein